MTETTIITILAIVAIVLVCGIPLYTVLKRNRITIEDDEETQEKPSVSMEVTPVNNSAPEPQLTQEPAVTSVPVVTDVPKVGKKRTTRTKGTNVKKVEKKAPVKKTAKKETKEQPALSKEFARKHLLRLTDEAPAKKSTRKKKETKKQK